MADNGTATGDRMIATAVAVTLRCSGPSGRIVDNRQSATQWANKYVALAYRLTQHDKDTNGGEGT